jgi:hypothetical protein
LVPANSFAEYPPEPNPEIKKKDVVWFALNEYRPLFAFAGLSPSGPLNEPGGRAGDRNPEYRDAEEPHGGGRDQHASPSGSGRARERNILPSGHLGPRHIV